ncbi:hypothetical protein C8J56DRAFT_787773 [Mycena floridula]|nr:hypothetical protein C8J56DRAFT_787773 [Mycena floridula]
MDQFTDIFLGFKRNCKRGVFGRVKHYYGVIEAQNQGSLHLHILIWLEGALSPLKIQEHATSDPEFRDRLFRWLESIFKHDLPVDTSPINGTRKDKTQCLLGRPPRVDSANFDQQWPQFLREVLDASGQVHTHGETCFKKLPFTMSSIPEEARDLLCRFNYPIELVAETFMDADGKLHHKRGNGMVVGHNPTISGSFQCNTDGKFVGSGALGMALAIYMSNYTAKASMDSASMMSALAAARKSLEQALSDAPSNLDEEQCRRLLLKTLNQMNSRRELSAQQVASSLLAIPNHISDAKFTVVYWTKLLSWLSPAHFAPNIIDQQQDVQIGNDMNNPESTDAEYVFLPLLNVFLTSQQRQ